MIDRSLVEKFLLRLPRFIFPKEKKKKRKSQSMQQSINYSNHILYHFKY